VRLFAAIVLSLIGATTVANAETEIDRAVARFYVRETGGVEAPRFVYMRELAFESRLESLAEGEPRPGEPPYRPRHVRAAFDRHVTETVLESLGIDPQPSMADIARRVDEARLALIERVRGVVPLREAAQAEGIAETEIIRLLRRQALASLYLDRMVAPMLLPTESELEAVHRTQRTPFSGRPFDEVEPVLRRWVVEGRLSTALSAYYDGLRTRLVVTTLK
jgi:hypothetical protein